MEVDEYEAICSKIRSDSLEDTLLDYNCSLKDLFDYCLHKDKWKSKRKEMYIQKQSTGRYRIRKSVDGKLIYFGYYRSLSDAVRVRDRLMELGWQRNLLKSIEKELGVTPL